MNIIGQIVSLIPGGLSIYVIVAVILIIALLRKWIVRAILAALAFFLALFLWPLGVISTVLWGPATYIETRLFGAIPEKLAGWLEALGSRTADPLRSGNRLATSHRIWNEARFPFLYKSVPPDIERPLYEDGKLVGGHGLVWLADRHITAMALVSAIRAGLTSGVVVMFLFCLELLNIAYQTWEAVHRDFLISKPVLERWPGQPDVTAPSGWWSSTVGAHIGFLLGHAALSVLWSFFGWLLVAVGVAISAAITALYLWRLEKSAPYTLVSKDADVRWNYRIEAREISNAIYRKQIGLSESYLQGTPLFKLGEATGSSRLRGDLAAPVKSQPLCLDRDSLFQHLLVLGGTGEGKTTAILKPLMRQLMVQPNYGFYVCDAKGVLWADALKVAEECGRAADVSVIGTGDGQFGVNPLENLTPTQIAATLRSVLRQVSGSSGNNFWPEMAVTVIRHVLTLAITYKMTAAGEAEAKKGTDPYSLWWAYQTVLSNERQAEVIGHIRALAETNDAKISKLMGDGIEDPVKMSETEAEARTLAGMISPEARSSLAYIETTWAGMANETKSGIIANVTQLLDGFSGAQTLRERFACGRSENTISIAQALEGRIILTALSSVEDGLPARLVLILLKTSLYREARRREAAFKVASPRKDPQKYPCIVLMDEVQEIVTSDPASGLSDATFWNVARSTGLAGIFATQTLAALNQALGDAAAANFVQQARSKVFFRSEDKETIEYACWCAGDYERNRVFEDSHRESIDHREALDGWRPFASVDENEHVKAGGTLLWSAASRLLTSARGDIGVAQRRKAYDPDLSFARRVPADSGSGTSGATTALQMEQGAVWRAEDRELAYRSEGNSVNSALTASDVINMGRWHAFAHVQRAGAVRQDIILVEHDYA